MEPRPAESGKRRQKFGCMGISGSFGSIETGSGPLWSAKADSDERARRQYLLQQQCPTDAVRGVNSVAPTWRPFVDYRAAQQTAFHFV
jgi:hypothetical protein